MPDPKPPSTTKPISVPLFAISWHTSPALFPKHIYASSGGGGSAKTGVNNFVEVVIQSPVQGQRTIKIDTGDDVGVALDIFSYVSDESTKDVSVFLAVGINNSVVMYSIILKHERNNGDHDNQLYTKVGKLEFEKGFLTNTVAFDTMGDRIAVGGENGCVYVCSMNWKDDDTMSITKDIEIKDQHIKGICKVTYHPANPNILLTSAKDGTCKVWDLSKPPSDLCLDVLECKIYDQRDIERKKNIPKKILNPAPGQCLVKACLFADLHGQCIFTVQSGRRGGAFLSVWAVHKVAVTENQIPAQEQKQEQPQFKIAFKEVSRVKVADFPVSAVSLSGDYKTLALGDTNGSVMLLKTENFKRFKYWECIHDLPVTCLAARPLPMPLAGEDSLGITVDIICASADSKMCFLTKQRKSTLKSTGDRRAGNGLGLGSFVSIFIICLMLFFILVGKISYDLSGDEFEGFKSLIQTVWWASNDRPGVAYVPI
jgi:WD40 repeat protein